MAETTQWDYKVLNTYKLYDTAACDEELEKDLKKLGTDGWELSGTTSNANGYSNIILKRPKKTSPNYDYGYSR